MRAGGSAQQPKTPPINAGSKDEENFIQCVFYLNLTSDPVLLIEDIENSYKVSRRRTRRARARQNIEEPDLYI